MTDPRIATDYLNNLFERLSAGDIAAGELDPDCVDWAFAGECWLAVMEASEKSREERNELLARLRPFVQATFIAPGHQGLGYRYTAHEPKFTVGEVRKAHALIAKLEGQAND